LICLFISELINNWLSQPEGPPHCTAPAANAALLLKGCEQRFRPRQARQHYCSQELAGSGAAISGDAGRASEALPDGGRLPPWLLRFDAAEPTRQFAARVKLGRANIHLQEFQV
jgi:hypothetical protein